MFRLIIILFVIISVKTYSQDIITNEDTKVICAKELNCYVVELNDSIGPAYAKLIIETLRIDFNLHRAFFDSSEQFFILETVSKIKQKQLESYINYKTIRVEKINKNTFLKAKYKNYIPEKYVSNFHIK